MKKKTALTAIILFTLATSLTAMCVIETAKADPFLFGVPPLIVNSPQTNPYLSVEPTINISFDYYVSKNLTQLDHFAYSLDENTNSILTSRMSDFNYTINYTTSMYLDYSVSLTLENLTNGNHSVIFYAQFLNGTINDIWNLTIIVDPTYKNPAPLMISPLNQTTYSSKEVPVIFTINSSAVGESLYSLDSSNNWQYLIGNGTLPNLSDGSHTLKLIITIGTQTDIRYVDYRETVYFNVDTNKTNSPPSPSPSTSNSPTLQPTTSPSVPEFPTWTILVLIITSIVIILFKKGKRKQDE